MNPLAATPRPPLLVTGLSGNLGQRLAPHLKEHLLVGVDLFPPQLDHPQVQFCPLDISQGDAPAVLEGLIRDAQVRQVIHLAFVLDPARTGAMARQRQWEINVRGTRHLLEAVERVNRRDRQVDFFLYLSSVTSYGPLLPYPVREDYPQEPHTYTYALHKKETDEMCRARHTRLNGCAVYVVRGHIFLGPGVDNFIVRALRGRPSDRTWLGRWVQRRRWRLPLLLPRGEKYRGHYQFMHIDDAARLMAWLCHHFEPGKLVVLNAQGRGAPVTGDDLARLCGLPLLRLPSYSLVGLLYRFFWGVGLSPVPPEAFPYFAGSYLMNTERLERLLGADYPQVIHFTAEEAVRATVTP
ncbi:MAG: NAD-dependent epimerase/dehydratase family protein [Acidobacteria bacterium]|nr:NAD-dependent epimerase/dehydratase family protein [Acidobacteriota bacterium]